MDDGTIGLILIVLGIVLLIAEALEPGFFIAIPGTVILCLGMIAVLAPDIFLTWISPLIVVLVCVPTTILVIKFYQRLAPPEPPTTTVGTSLIGKEGTVTVEIRPKAISGKVEVENQRWSATAKTAIPVGTDVRIVESRGVHVVVEPMDERRNA